MTETAVTRVTAFLNGAENQYERGVIDTRATGDRRRGFTFHEFRVADVKALLQLLADYCENDPDTDHGVCAYCDTVLCSGCGLGDEATDCEAPGLDRHCNDCWNECRTCRTEVLRDEEADRQFEWARTGGL